MDDTRSDLGQATVFYLLTVLVFTRRAGGRAAWASLDLTRAGWRQWPLAIGLPLAHGAFNTIWSALAALAVPTSTLWMEYLSGESGAITLVLAIVAVTYLYCKGQKVLLKKPAQIPRPGIST